MEFTNDKGKTLEVAWICAEFNDGKRWKIYDKKWEESSDNLQTDNVICEYNPIESKLFSRKEISRYPFSLSYLPNLQTKIFEDNYGLQKQENFNHARK